MKTKYNPTPAERCAVACAYDNENRASFDPVFSPSDYEANGACVTLRDDGGATYWVITLTEARALRVSFDTCDRIKIGRRVWVVTLA